METAIIIIVVLIVLGFVLYAIMTTKVTSHDELADNFSQLAALIGVKATLPKGENTYPSLKGAWKGHQLNCYMEQINTADKGQTHMVLELAVKSPKEKTLVISYEDFMSKIGKFFSGDDIQTGNENLDKKFIFKSNDETFAKKVLDLELQNSLISNVDLLKGHLELEESKLTWVSVFEISEDQQVQDFEKMLNLCELLITKIEQYS